jgi:hypothetical protein
MNYTYKIIKLFNGQYGIIRSDQQPYWCSFFKRSDAVKIKHELEVAE